jgi:ubiquinone/menaquinone biosynthesis C-methylase UbiE
MTDCNSWDMAAQARVSDRWASASANWNREMTDALLAEAALNPSSVVLDVAAGSGDPALSIAERLATGRVIAIDSSRVGLMLATARAEQLKLGSRMACLQADAHAIPVADNSVDRICCRCGIMFFNDVAMVMGEMSRVLRPGGRVALLAWGSFEQPFFDATVGVVMQQVRGSGMPVEARKMFRFAAAGSLEGHLRDAGFSHAHEESLIVHRIWAGTPKELWTYQQEVSTLCHPLFAGIPPALKPEVDAKVSSALVHFQDGNVLKVPVEVIVAAGRKPSA